ncbi:hypothetical protein HDU81_001980 [Chytriomyces hyalinus]|nr:hypothetical protein HDU81_001980 [Chytriomyces hyalinus]
MRGKAIHRAVNKWYEVAGVPKVCSLDRSKKPLGIVDIRVPGRLDAAAVKEDAKTTVPESGPKQCVSTPPNLGLSFKTRNSFSKQEAQLSTTTAATADSEENKDSAVEADEDEDDEWDNDNCEDEDGVKYEHQDLEHDMDCMPSYKPYQGYSPREVLEALNPLILLTFPHLNKAINEWYEIHGVPKVYLDPSKGAIGILELRVPGNLAKNFARHVGTRYMQYRNAE